MSKLNITPDMAELIGAYNEGAPLAKSEREMVEQWLHGGLITQSELSEIVSFPIISADDDMHNISVPHGEMAMDFMNNDDFAHSSIIGDVTPFPDVMGHDIIQQQSDTCAIKSQQIILHAFGIDIPESILTMEATTKGYYIPGQGSNPQDVGNLLEDHGVGTHSKSNATIYDLMFELTQGHKVIVGVDADELWRPSYFNDLFGEQANHALIVSGIDTSNPFDTRVIITDPGTGDVARSYPVDQFLDAWHDSACMMVATDEAPALSYPNGIYNPEMVNFDYAIGHIPSVGNIPYDIFANTVVPRMDDFYLHQLPEMPSITDYAQTFDQMHHIYDSVDSFASNGLENNDVTWDDIDSMFDSFLI